MHGFYTDANGLAHIRRLGTGQTYCGVDAFWARLSHPMDGCEACVHAYTLDYAQREAERLCGWPRHPEES